MKTTTSRTALLALILAVCAIAASPAGARPIDDPTLGSPDYTAPAAPPSREAPVGPQAPVGPEAPVAQPAPSQGFDWGDAGIGAAVIAGLALFAGAGAVALTHRRSVSGRTVRAT